MLKYVIIISSNSFRLHYDNLMPLRDVGYDQSRRLKQKIKQRSLGKERENITIHSWRTVYGMNVMLHFQKNIKINKSNGNSFYATGKKDGWLIAIVLSSH